MAFYPMYARDVEIGDAVTVWGQRGSEPMDRTVTVTDIRPAETLDGLTIPGGLEFRTASMNVCLLVLEDMLLGVER